MVDPQHEIEPYLEAAAQKSMRVSHIIETHVQADHVSGARRLADVTGAPILMHQAADVRFAHTDMVDGDQLDLGNVGIGQELQRRRRLQERHRSRKGLARRLDLLGVEAFAHFAALPFGAGSFGGSFFTGSFSAGCRE